MSESELLTSNFLASVKIAKLETEIASLKAQLKREQDCE